MSKTYCSWDLDRAWLYDFVPAGHPAQCAREMVLKALNLRMRNAVDGMQKLSSRPRRLA